MLIVGCQHCGKTEILPGTPDPDGVARTRWTCPRCGAGQVLQLPLAADARGKDLRQILGGLALLPTEPLASSDAPAAQEPLHGLP